MASSKSHENRKSGRQTFSEYKKVQKIVKEISDLRYYADLTEGHAYEVESQSEHEQLIEDARQLRNEADSLIEKLSVRY